MGGRQLWRIGYPAAVEHAHVASLRQLSSRQLEVTGGMSHDVGIVKQHLKGVGFLNLLVVLPVVVGRDQTHHITINVTF